MAQAALASKVSLDDKWDATTGRVLITGTQALARIMLEQKRLDEERGLNTAGFITGYRGSPLGGVDTTLWSISKRLEKANIRFLPGINEDLAATTVRGTQQLDAVPDPLYDGVFAAWYGKGPGVDRAGDALKHGNFHGVHRNGGVVVFYGDDHGGKSSSIAHHSEQAMTAALIPSLYPADVSDILEFGLLGFALSRYSGSWAALKLVNEVVEQTATVEVQGAYRNFVSPPRPEGPPEGVYARPKSFGPLREEQIVVEHRLPLVLAFLRANRVDREVFRAKDPVLGIVTAGKSHGDTMQALALLGLSPAAATELGISLYKVGCIWPLEPEGVKDFAKGHRELFFVEEKQAFVEPQAAAVLVNDPDRPRLIGKKDENGQTIFPSATQLEPSAIALAIVARLRALGLSNDSVEAAASVLSKRMRTGGAADGLPKRSPYFCSGCPHNRSTRVPDGSLSMTGIGCHTMVNFVRPEIALPPTHMGGEGTNWVGLAPYVGTDHIFQNMGDGTYFHSGLMAIRASVASGVNITYKILYNDAVAMTGGQPVDGPISVAEIARQLDAEGVVALRLVSDDPDRWMKTAGLPSRMTIHHRDELDAVQRELRTVAGCTVIIYEQTCAAEKRRRRKRGLYPDPDKRMFIASEVCEGCGDCSVQSTCVSLAPKETALGTKRQIDQSSCNKDYTCIDGFCPSFITVRGAGPIKKAAAMIPDTLFADLPDPVPAVLPDDQSWNVMIAGIGGTGVITVAAIAGMAAHIEGKSVSIFDMTGLSQKNGAVFSHLRIASDASLLNAQKIGRGEANVLLAMDPVSALADEARLTVEEGKTLALVNAEGTATVALQFERDTKVDVALLVGRIRKAVGSDQIVEVPASELALALLGDTIGGNMMAVGVAVQRGLLPLSPSSIENAIELNGTAVKFNLSAFRLGRLFAALPERLAKLLPSRPAKVAETLDEVLDLHARRLTEYQDAAFAERYVSQVKKLAAAEDAAVPGSELVSTTVARNLARVIAIKDEYEVARLLTSDALTREIEATFGKEGSLSFNLAPPFLPGRHPNGRPLKREFSVKRWAPMFRLLAKGRKLRGTRLDLFGYTTERKAERALLEHYERLIGEVTLALRSDNLPSAAKVLARVGEVRGFGPVKEKALEAYYADIPGMLEDFRKAPNKSPSKVSKVAVTA